MRTSRLHFFLLDGYQDLIAGLLSCLMHSGWMMIIAYFMAVCAGNRSSCANSCYDNWIGLQFPSASVGWHGTAAWGTALLLNIHGGFVFWGKKFPPWLIPGSIVTLWVHFHLLILQWIYTVKNFGIDHTLPNKWCLIVMPFSVGVVSHKAKDNLWFSWSS